VLHDFFVENGCLPEPQSALPFELVLIAGGALAVLAVAAVVFAIVKRKRKAKLAAEKSDKAE